MAGIVGLEPTNAGIKILCLTDLGYTPVAGAKGIEPLSKDLESSILPLN